MAAALLLTPQVWYLFSYATSDAWDYFLSFLLLGSAVVLIPRIVKHGMSSPKLLLVAAFLGLMAALLWLGKLNYHLSLVLFGAICLDRGGSLSGAARKPFVRFCIVLLSVFFFSLFLRHLLAWIHFAGGESAAYLEAAVGKHDHSYLPGRKMLTDGKSFCDVMACLFLGRSWQSFAGMYGWMSIPSSKGFYWLFGGILCGWVVVMAIDAVRMTSWRTGLRRLGLFSGGIAVAIGASFWNSWNCDFQAQGRYLFPAVAGVFPLAETVCHRPRFSRLASLFLLLLGALSLVGFLHFGLATMLESNGAKTVWRFYSPSARRHCFTIDEAKVDQLMSADADWVLQRGAYRAFTNQVEGTVALHQLHAPSYHDDLLTTNEIEWHSMISLDSNWQYEGVAHYVYPRAERRSFPVFRFRNVRTGEHFYTQNEAEKILLHAASSWDYEGIAF